MKKNCGKCGAKPAFSTDSRGRAGLEFFKLAIVLLALLAAVIAAATVLESSAAGHTPSGLFTRAGGSRPCWSFWGSTCFSPPPFAGVEAEADRFRHHPWGTADPAWRRHPHLRPRHRGQVTLAEGKSTSRMVIPEQDQVTAFWL